MVTRDTAWLPGTPCWVDVSVDSVEKATAFYGALFGWEVEISPDPEFGGHGNFTKDGRQVAGVSPTLDPAQPQAWLVFLASDDVEQSAGKITAAGGTLLSEVLDIGEHGRMIVAVDPSGAAFGLWQSGTHTGMQLANELGSVTWNENMSRDYEGNKKFYTEAFGFDYTDMGGDDFSYSTFDVNGKPVGGIGVLPDDVPAEVPPHWTTYFVVADTDAAVAKVRELGGSVVTEPFDIPQGRVASVTDDQGAVFWVMTPAG